LPLTAPFAIELTWKSLKRVLADEGVETGTPREALMQAYKARWIDDEALWLSMLRDRNATSHIYDEDTARQIYAHPGLCPGVAAGLVDAGGPGIDWFR
jgi:nucleotidyltransferase substrate binding protein (TIGR01987 family)